MFLPMLLANFNGHLNSFLGGPVDVSVPSRGASSLKIAPFREDRLSRLSRDPQSHERASGADAPAEDARTIACSLVISPIVIPKRYLLFN